MMTTFPSGELTAAQLRAADIDVVFGVVAAPVIPLFHSIAMHGIRVVCCRHEQQAAFMAQVWASVRRQPGVVVVGTGPALTNTLTSLYVAQQNEWPLVVIGGSASTAERALGAFQELDQVRVARSVCRWTATAAAAERIPELVRLALNAALGPPRGPVYLDLPADVVMQQRSAIPGEGLVTAFRRPAPAAPNPAAVAAAAELLATAANPLLVVGEGSAWAQAGDALSRLADAGLPFVTSPMARGVVDDAHPSHVAACRGQALGTADTVMMIGGRFDWMYPMFDRREGINRGARLIQISDSADASLHGADVDVIMAADVRLSVEAVASRLAGHGADGTATWLAELQQLHQAKKQRLALDVATCLTRVRLTQAHLFAALGEVLSPDDVVVMDGEVTSAAGRMLLPGPAGPDRRFDTGRTGCMGIGVPYAIGAKLAMPQRRVVAVLGDYAFGASAMEVETAARVGAPVTFVVANNGGVVGGDLQEAVFGDTGQPIASLIPADYQLLADMIGGLGRRVTTMPELKGALSEAVSYNGVSLVNVILHPTDHGIPRTKSYLTGGYTIRGSDSRQIHCSYPHGERQPEG